MNKIFPPNCEPAMRNVNAKFSDRTELKPIKRKKEKKKKRNFAHLKKKAPLRSDKKERNFVKNPIQFA